ncbi:hypothetical protein SLOPH_1759 [Spraguea lophii 42_110]|uniref:Inner centromere protein ARK-binding domain-containing protein n=1 Tax=Spraguea lophii (strain 42_110) TaxID=1358809 RepID=S7W795_SPRLO|nr:hypothetical protein SLOPH_1759 [Spraguea lophii 42_110]
MFHIEYIITFKKIMENTLKEIKEYFNGNKKTSNNIIAEKIQRKIDEILKDDPQAIKKRKIKREKISTSGDMGINDSNKSLTKGRRGRPRKTLSTDQCNSIIMNIKEKKKTIVEENGNCKTSNIVDDEQKININPIKRKITRKNILVENKSNKDSEKDIKEKPKIIRKTKKGRILKNLPKRTKKVKKEPEIKMNEIDVEEEKIVDKEINNDERKIETDLIAIENIQKEENNKENIAKNTIKKEKTTFRKALISNYNKDSEQINLHSNTITSEINIKKERENIAKILEQNSIPSKIEKEFDNKNMKIETKNDKSNKEKTNKKTFADAFSALKKDYTIKKINESKLQEKLNSSFIQDDIYKKTINKQIASSFSRPSKIDYNTYTPKTKIPTIDSDDMAKMVPSFIRPQWVKETMLDDLLKKQNHEILENFYKTDAVDITMIFPHVKDISNYSPNKIMFRKYTDRKL